MKSLPYWEAFFYPGLFAIQKNHNNIEFKFNKIIINLNGTLARIKFKYQIWNTFLEN